MAEASVRETVREVWEVLTIPSFLIIINQVSLQPSVQNNAMKMSAGCSIRSP